MGQLKEDVRILDFFIKGFPGFQQLGKRISLFQQEGGCVGIVPEIFF